MALPDSLKTELINHLHSNPDDAKEVIELLGNTIDVAFFRFPQGPSGKTTGEKKWWGGFISRLNAQTGKPDNCDGRSNDMKDWWTREVEPFLKEIKSV